MRNVAICLKSDQNFNEGFAYECSYVDNGMVDIFSKDGDPIVVDADDKDFVFILNCNDELFNFVKRNYTVFIYENSIVEE
jgi:hypothetical protein